MAKLSRRDFIKRMALLGSFAPFIDIEAIRENLSNFSDKQIESISEIEEIRLSDSSPYSLLPGHTRDNVYYDIFLKDGTHLWLSDLQIKERYGNILDYFIKSEPGLLPSNDYPAIWND